MKVLILEPSNFSTISINLLEQSNAELFFGLSSLPSSLYEHVSILYARLAYMLDSTFLSQFPSLKYVVSPATGIAHIDLEYLKSNTISLISLKGQTDFLRKITPTIEINVWLILSLLRKAHLSSYSSIHATHPNAWIRDNYIGNDLYDATVGIVGLGRIGSHVASVLSTLGSNIVYYDPFVCDQPYEKVSLNTLLEVSDVVSINCIYNESTDKLIASDELLSLRSNSVLVNTARGGIVDEDSLHKHLLEYPDFKCGLDVLKFEHDNSHDAFISKTNLQQFSLDNPHQLILTPHIGGASFSAMRKTEDFCTQLLINELKLSFNIA